jgi:hypothetical protein
MINSCHYSGNSSLFQIEFISLWISEWIVLPPAFISSDGSRSVPGDLCHLSFSVAISISEALGSDTSGSAVCMPACLTSCTFNSWEKWFLHVVRISLGACNQIIHLILYFIDSELVSLLKVIDAPILVYIIYIYTSLIPWLLSIVTLTYTGCITYPPYIVFLSMILVQYETLSYIVYIRTCYRVLSL